MGNWQSMGVVLDLLSREGIDTPVPHADKVKWALMLTRSQSARISPKIR
jgi:hypothetical protein